MGSWPPPPDHPTVEILDERGQPTGVIGRAHTVRTIGGVETVEVASGGRRFEVPSWRVRVLAGGAMPELVDVNRR